MTTGGVETGRCFYNPTKPCTSSGEGGCPFGRLSATVEKALQNQHVDTKRAKIIRGALRYRLEDQGLLDSTQYPQQPN